MADDALQQYISTRGNDGESEEFVTYNICHNVFKGGLSKHEVVDYYNKEYGPVYNENNPRDRYRGPQLAALALAEHFTTSEAEHVRILDVAAGTGLLGDELYRLGFRNIDALDPSDVMLDKARERGVYKNFFMEFMDPENPLDIEDDTYSGIGSAGGFGEGHIPCEAFTEMIRIVKPGGCICVAMRKEYLDYVPAYKDTFYPFMKRLEKEGKWTLVKEEVTENYFCGKQGLTFHYRVL